MRVEVVMTYNEGLRVAAVEILEEGPEFRLLRYKYNITDTSYTSAITYYISDNYKVRYLTPN